MRLEHLVALLVGVLSSAVLATSCIGPSTEDPDERVEAAPGELASVFNPWVFRVTREYDGDDAAGGEQEATAAIGFITETVPPHTFSCPVRVRMPVYSSKYKRIGKRYAADVTLMVSNEAADLMDWRYWGEPTTLYCQQFIEKMQTVFYERYKGLGARVTRP